VYGPHQQQTGYSSAHLENSKQVFTIPLTNLTAGRYSLVVNATGVLRQDAQTSMDNADDSKQITIDFKVKTPDIPEPDNGPDATDKYDYIFPECITDYDAGTKVLQPRNNRIYQCKPFPNSGFCRQWSQSSNAYEPGVGFAWKSAWTLVN